MAKKLSGVAGLETGAGPKRFDIPASIDLERATRDAELVARKLRDDSEGVREVLEAARAGDKRAAIQKLKDLGMSEDDFKREGGGLFWLLVVLVLLYATDAY